MTLSLQFTGHSDILFVMFSRPLIACVEKQLIEKHVTAVLQKGKLKWEDTTHMFEVWKVTRSLCCVACRTRSDPRREPAARPATLLPTALARQGRTKRPQRRFLGVHQGVKKTSRRTPKYMYTFPNFPRILLATVLQKAGRVIVVNPDNDVEKDREMVQVLLGEWVALSYFDYA